jgi:phosphate starvation-inducible PhoH-like protein
MHKKNQSPSMVSHSQPEEPVGTLSPKLVNRPKFQGNCPKLRRLVCRPNQQRFMDLLQHPQTNIVALLGPAGSGKTLLAVQKGLEGILNRRYADLVLCRPLIGAGGEEMGFLPGDVQDKIGPYLEPFYDKLTALLPATVLKSLIEAKHITAAPLAFMRGRTFSESLVILDEAQNATVEQIKMAVTRIGPFSKMVVCGDPDQSDIPGLNGLQYLAGVLERENQAAERGCGVCRLGMEDIQRNGVIPFLLEAFARNPARPPVKKPAARAQTSAHGGCAVLPEKALVRLLRMADSNQRGGGARRRASRSLDGPGLGSDLFEWARRGAVVMAN